jgi:hypothetical protein
MNPSVKIYSRREMLAATAGCLGAASLSPALAALEHPLAARPPHFTGRAKNVIFFFLAGGLSHVDSFDPKPELSRRHGQKGPGSSRNLKKSPWKEVVDPVTGITTTDLFPHINSQLHEIALIRSMTNVFGDHYEATLHMHTGARGEARPSIGAWLSYGLGTENTSLPAHMVIAKKEVYGGAQNWDANFLPAFHQGTRVTPTAEPIKHTRPDSQTLKIQPQELSLLERMNQRHWQSRKDTDELAARMLSFKTARNLQTWAPSLFDLSRESPETLGTYGMQKASDRSFAWQCLMARRLVEQGVRFIEVIDDGNWDHHSNISAHGKLAQNIDKPIAGLISDLRQRGMLDDTLLVFATEFGRTPTEDSNPTGRGHHRNAFTCWLAGGGVKGGSVYGSSDELGSQVAEQAVTINDFHATILQLAGFDHERLTFPFKGRDFRLTDLAGDIIHDVIA